MSDFSDRIVIDPDGLRRLAAGMRGASTLLTSTARRLVRRPLPTMPAGVAGMVVETLSRVDAELQDLATGLVRDAGTLLARANQAELGRFERVGWHGRGLQRFELPVGDPDAGSAGGDQTGYAEMWSIELLSDASDSMGSEPTGGESLDVASVFDRDVSADLPGNLLGEFTLTAAAGYDALQLQEPDATDGPGSPGAGGVLGVALQHAVADPSGTGILGCVLVGADIGDLEDDDPGEQT